MNSYQNETDRLQRLADRQNELWNPEVQLARRTKAKESISHETERLAQADARGEEVIEIHIPVTVKVPVGMLLDDPDTAIDNLRFRTSPQIEAGIISHLVSNHSEIIEAVKRYEELGCRLYGMWRWSNEDQKDLRTPSYSYDEGMQLIEEREGLELELLKTVSGFDRKVALPYLEKLKNTESAAITV